MWLFAKRQTVLEPSTAAASISPVHPYRQGEPMVYRETRIGAFGFVIELSHELWSASHQPFKVSGGCSTKRYSEEFIRLFGSRTTMPRESLPLIDPDELTYLPLPMET